MHGCNAYYVRRAVQMYVLNAANRRMRRFVVVHLTLLLAWGSTYEAIVRKSIERDNYVHTDDST